MALLLNYTNIYSLYTREQSLPQDDPCAIPLHLSRYLIVPSRAFGDGGICSIKSFNQWSVSGISYQNLQLHIITPKGHMTRLEWVARSQWIYFEWSVMNSVFFGRLKHLFADLIHGEENSQISEELPFVASQELWNSSANIRISKPICVGYGWFAETLSSRCLHIWIQDNSLLNQT